MKIEGDVLTKEEWEWLLANTKREVVKVPKVNGAPMFDIKESISSGQPCGGFRMDFDSIDERDLTVDQMRIQGLI